MKKLFILLLAAVLLLGSFPVWSQEGGAADPSVTEVIPTSTPVIEADEPLSDEGGISAEEEAE